MVVRYGHAGVGVKPPLIAGTGVSGLDVGNTKVYLPQLLARPAVVRATRVGRDLSKILTSRPRTAGITSPWCETQKWMSLTGPVWLHIQSSARNLGVVKSTSQPLGSGNCGKCILWPSPTFQSAAAGAARKTYAPMTSRVVIKYFILCSPFDSGGSAEKPVGGGAALCVHQSKNTQPLPGFDIEHISTVHAGGCRKMPAQRARSRPENRERMHPKRKTPTPWGQQSWLGAGAASDRHSKEVQLRP